MTGNTQNPRQSVSAAFDSVNLIDRIISMTGSPTQEIIDTVWRNTKHLEIMMEKQWFVDALINNEGSEIQSCIVRGNNYLNSHGR